MRLKCLLPLLPATVLAAQEPMPFLDMGPPGVEHGWSASLGARVLDHPAYLGSDRQRTDLLPVFSAEYDRRWFLGTSRVGPGFGGGAHLVQSGGFTWDLGAGFGDSRPESRAPLLAGMGDEKAYLFIGTGVHYRRQGFHAGLTLSHGLREDAGDLATLTVSQTVPLAPGWHFTGGLHGTWADTDAMAYGFGISPAQAANRAALAASGAASFTPAQIGPFSPSAGARDAGALLGLSWRPGPRWTWTVGLHGGVLLGGLRDSPLVARNDYYGAGLGFAYHF